MKDYLVDVPVSTQIWIRTEIQKRQFKVIREARPRILFLISDGGRTEEEWKAIYENRRIFDDGIDWDCTVYRMYEKENLGLYRTGQKNYELVWKHVDRCIFLEDDIVPAVSFFRFCEEMLEMYKNDTRISMICGMNYMGTYEECKTDYFFSRRGSVWGYALWKRTYDLNWNMSIEENSHEMENLKKWTKKQPDYLAILREIQNTGYTDQHPPGTEFFMKQAVCAQNQLYIVPKKNQIKNIGYGADTSHGDELSRLPKGIRNMYDKETYELDFPLSHPTCVIPDVTYEKRQMRITGYGHPFIRRWRRFERAWLILTSGDSGLIGKKIKKLFDRKRIEK